MKGKALTLNYIVCERTEHVICSCITGKEGCEYCGGTGFVSVAVIGQQTTE